MTNLQEYISSNPANALTSYQFARQKRLLSNDEGEPTHLKQYVKLR